MFMLVYLGGRGYMVYERPLISQNIYYTIFPIYSPLRNCNNNKLLKKIVNKHYFHKNMYSGFFKTDKNIRRSVCNWYWYTYHIAGYISNYLIITYTVESRKQLRRCIKCQFFKFFKIRVVFEILLNSIVCFFAFSSSYIQVRVIIKVELFSRFYGITNMINVNCVLICLFLEVFLYFLFFFPFQKCSTRSLIDSTFFENLTTSRESMALWLQTQSL